MHPRSTQEHLACGAEWPRSDPSTPGVYASAEIQLLGGVPPTPALYRLPLTAPPSDVAKEGLRTGRVLYRRPHPT
eukprot:CAMPEP_0180376950 /NCGR_PEP_ID=MMETSP0989-20121125/23751_1 /TAXON_ID=697907 /ORGANISM="non described non described, Strain CCMP2293" /LENGTH=74 /DNA_ID=CAMNT_0022375325 /DNA_START=207 /DNA_END=428 /DNA_ORIENTATION=+